MLLFNRVSANCLVALICISAPAVAQQAYPAAATAAKSKYDRDLGAASAKYQRQYAAALKEYQDKLAAAKAEYDESAKSAFDTYVSALDRVKRTETSAGNREGAAAVQYTIDLLLKGPPRTEIQLLWIKSFAAETKYEYDEAIEAVNQVLRITGDRNNTFAQTRLGWLHYLKKDYERAIKAYEAAAKLSPVAVTPLLGLVNCHRAANQLDEAIAAAKRVVDLSPLNYTANLALAQLYYIRKDYRNSGVYYYKLASSYPDNLEMASNLAWCYLKIGRAETANGIFGAVLAVLPDHAEANTGFAASAKTRNSSGRTKTRTQSEHLTKEN